MHFKYFSVVEIQNFLRENGLAFNKKFGQNFLINSGVVDTILKHASLTKNDLVIEIGCGLGTLTNKLIKTGCKLIGFEIDKAFIKNLIESFSSYDNFSLIEGDFLKKINGVLEDIDFAKYERIIYIGNLPYNITTPIMEKIFLSDKHFDFLIFMMQKEVGNRITAKEGTKEYGSLSIFCQFYTDPKIIARPGPKSFYPPPKVESAVVFFKKKDKTLSIRDKTMFFKVARSLFINRRKQIKNNLIHSPFINNLTENDIIKILENAGIPKEIRGEKLSIQKVADLSNEFYDYFNKIQEEGS